MNRDETDGAVDIKAQIEKARRREILIPAVITAAAFGIGSVAAVWLGVVYPGALGRLSDSLITFFFIVTTAALLIGFALNAFFIV